MAGGITESVVEEIKARIDLAELISSYGIAVRHAGGSYKACCPFHNEKTPSFNIQPDKGFYHCFGCGESGDAISFVTKYEGLSFVEAVRKLADQCGVKIDPGKADPEAGKRKRLYALHAELAVFYQRCLTEIREAEPARAYLNSRDLSPDVVDKFQIGYVPKGATAILTWAKKHNFTEDELAAAGVLKPPRTPGDNWYNQFGGRLAFSIRDRSGRVVAFSCRTLETDKTKMRGGKYVNSPETPIFKKSNILFAFDLAGAQIVKAPHREAIVCEGQIDVIRCHAAGFSTAVASQGTAFTEEHVRMLKKCADCVVLVFDGDGAGHKAAVRTGGLFLAAEIPVRVATLPEGEDPDSLIRKFGPESFRDCLSRAESVTAFQARVLTEKEEHPDTIDAVTRISRAVLATIKQCPSAVMRANLLNEAAVALNLPLAALEADLAQIGRTQSPAAVAEEMPVVTDEIEASDAGSADNNPPGSLETSLCTYLYAHIDDANTVAFVRELVPAALFPHPYMQGFMRAWYRHAEQDAGAFDAYWATLSPAGRSWFDFVSQGVDMTAQTERPFDEIVGESIRRAWADFIAKAIGALPAAASSETDNLRMQYAILAKRVRVMPLEALVKRIKEIGLWPKDEINE